MAHKEFRFPIAKPRLTSSERRHLLDAFDSGWISSKGKYIDLFENGFAKFIGVRQGISTSNGTVALHLALSAMGIRRGDEVIVPDLTFVSPANAVAYTGARPTFADSNPQYWGIDADTVRPKITKQTKAVIAVHLYGHPVDLRPLVELCETKGISLLEDCAEAHGAEYEGTRVGQFGSVSCFSFYGNKILSTGEGGMCLTDNDELAERMRILRDHGQDKNRKFWHLRIGFNYRMTNLQAAIGYAQLARLTETIESYRQISRFYREGIDTTLFAPHPEMAWAKCVFWVYTIIIKHFREAQRDALRDQLAKRGIETRPMFYPISTMPPYRSQKFKGSIASGLSQSGISLPTYVGLRREDVELITEILAEEAELIRGK